MFGEKTHLSALISKLQRILQSDVTFSLSSSYSARLTHLIGAQLFTTYLALPYYDDGRKNYNEIWTIEVPIQKQPSVFFSADLPQRRYSFPPIAVPQRTLDKYKSGNGIILYRDKALSEPIGTLGIDNNLLEVSGDAVKVQSGKSVGWVSFNDLKFPNGMLDFVSGVFRLYRGDWESVESYMSKVAGNMWSSTAIKVDANLLRAFASERRNVSGREAVRSAKRLSQFSKRVVIYETMMEVAELSRRIKAGLSNQEKSEIIGIIRKNLEDNVFLFDDNDVWLNNTRAKLLLIN